MCAACNDILVIKKNGKIEYHGSSTDEMTLVQAAADREVQLLYREGDQIQVDVYGKVRKFKVRHKVEFTSERKRMTVVLENQDEDEDIVYIYSKGADSVILESCTT